MITPTADSICCFAVSDDAEEEVDRPAQVVAAGRTFVLLVLPERTVVLWE